MHPKVSHACSKSETLHSYTFMLKNVIVWEKSDMELYRFIFTLWSPC